MVNLILTGKEREAALARAVNLPSVQLSKEVLSYVVLLAEGGLAPLDHFMGADEVMAVTETMQLLDGSFFPAPLVLPVLLADLPDEFEAVVLRDEYFNTIAVMDVEEVFQFEESPEAACLAGKLQVVNLPKQVDFLELRKSPAMMQKAVAEDDVVLGMFADGPMRKLDALVMRAAMDEVDGLVSGMVLPVFGWDSKQDLAYFTKVRSWLLGDWDVVLSDLAMRKASLADVLLRAVVAKNFGVTHLVLDEKWEEEVSLVADALAMQFVFVDLEESDQDWRETIHETDYLPAVRTMLEDVAPPKEKQGLVLWFTGLSGSGKSTIANLVAPQLLAHGRQLTVLDGDVVRTHLSKGLTFSAEDRDTNILRIGYVAAEIAKHGGTVMCAAISPFRKTREAVRAMVGTDKFVEIYVATTLAEAEARDVKGLYAKARAGELKNFTGIDSPYEAPLDAEIVVPTVGKTPQECADEVVAALKAAGYLKELAR